MIISKAPSRITFAGGGTDIEAYYKNSSGFLIAAGINKYTRVMANRGYYNYIHLKYSKEEKAESVKEISHPIFREMLNWFSCKEPIELISMADYPVGCGLGTSGSFSVALAKCLGDYYHQRLSRRDCADIACAVEIDTLKDPIGKQDQYAAAHGGINGYTFHSNGYVSVEPIDIHYAMLDQLENNLLLFDTQIPRKSSYVLDSQVDEMKNGGVVISKLNKTKEMAFETKRLLEKGKLDEWGSLLNDYWQLRKTFSDKVSNPFIDEAYEVAIKNGALGGKLQGAGGGGFLMFYTKNRTRLVEALERVGLRHLPFNFDFEGVCSWKF